MSPVEDEEGPLVGGPEVGDIYSVGANFCFRMPDLRRLDKEADELMGSDVPTTRSTSACTSQRKSIREAAASAALHVKHVTVEMRRVTLKRSSVSLENRGSKKRCDITCLGSWSCKKQYVSSGQLKKHVDNESIKSKLDPHVDQDPHQMFGQEHVVEWFELGFGFVQQVADQTANGSLAGLLD